MAKSGDEKGSRTGERLENPHAIEVEISQIDPPENILCQWPRCAMCAEPLARVGCDEGVLIDER